MLAFYESLYPVRLSVIQAVYFTICISLGIISTELLTQSAKGPLEIMTLNVGQNTFRH